MRGYAFVLIMLAAAACDAPEPPARPSDAPAPPIGEPEPVDEIAVTPPDSGVFVDFQWATSPADPDTTRARLEAWLRLHGPIDGAWEDAVHRRFHRIAQYRLARLYYHAGMRERGDSLLAVLEETDEAVR